MLSLSLSLPPQNPSHLEAVNPVVVGKVRAKQDLDGDATRSAVMGVLMHGDAAFAGQGIVYETFLLAKLAGYGTGGTVHVIVNNQVGFTTDPESARSTLHCSDLGKAFDVPIFHVNGDDPEAVVRVFELAAEYRATFKSDVIVDLVCYRRHGHNELDQPAYTQPVMYAAIAGHASTLDRYQAALAGAAGGAGVPAADLAAVRASVDAAFAAAWEAAKAPPGAAPAAAGAAAGASPSADAWLTSRWQGVLAPGQRSRIQATGVAPATLRAIGARLTALPAGFAVHPSLARILKQKEEMFASGAGFDWATAEALAFGSLALEGQRVRLSGQDVERGTFSHRHAVLHDQASNATHCPLAHLADGQAPFTAVNSPLSEFGVMGFELGYAMETPNQLVLWEGQCVRRAGAEARGLARNAAGRPFHLFLSTPHLAGSATLSTARRSSSTSSSLRARPSGSGSAG